MRIIFVFIVMIMVSCTPTYITSSPAPDNPATLKTSDIMQKKAESNWGQGIKCELSYDTETKILRISSADKRYLGEEFEVMESSPTWIRVKKLNCGNYLYTNQAPGPTNPFYPCYSDHKIDRFEWEKIAVNLVNGK